MSQEQIGTQESNPLKKYYRQPKQFVRLPSNYKYYKPGTIQVPESGEVAVFPMTAKDELLFKTPDALLNGEATVRVIQSCIPAITNAWEMPALDIDTCLVAIRMATYGTKMQVKVFVPKAPAVVTNISAKIASKNIVWIKITIVIARAKCGIIINQNLPNKRAPSISAASICSLSSDCIAVKRIRVAKGNHCQLKMIVNDKIDSWLNHWIGSDPKALDKCAKKPFTGSMNMFFQTNPETVGITKNGAINIILTIPWPQKG